MIVLMRITEIVMLICAVALLVLAVSPHTDLSSLQRVCALVGAGGLAFYVWLARTQ
jgi:hypothetical protein